MPSMSPGTYGPTFDPETAAVHMAIGFVVTLAVAGGAMWLRRRRRKPTARPTAGGRAEWKKRTRVLGVVAASTTVLGMSGQPAEADDEAHVELAQDIEHETDSEWLRLACPNYVAAEAKRRETAKRRTVRGAPYVEPPAVAKCAGVLAGR